ncbi:hypothetical protein BRARA_I02390 [Brassica rapa]|uniref:DUF1985 domain-containing protein n=1 Tax=Brassica campestris TaxID=3711 RepID=A0A397Y206_BRACM|nr:hypothetical protein BRARA_I02390 [Brassica rapa]
MQPDPRLPLRLFATDRFPINKLNIYSSPEILPFLRHVLRDTKEFQTIRQSCFGKLFDIPSQQAPISTKLIHYFLSRQLICGGDHTLFSVFGGNPFRYGLQEFGAVTGLNCSPFTEGYHPDTAKAKLFGEKNMITIAELCQMLEEDKDMLFWKKIRIALIIIVDGVLIAHKQTISCMKPPKPAPPKIKDPIAWLVHKLKQRSFRLQGFPLTLQLVAFQAIPQLLHFIPAPFDNRTLMDLEDGYLPQHGSINFLDIRRVEFSSNLSVSPVIAIENQAEPGWGDWPNKTKDDRLIYLEHLISEKYTFNKAMWPGGVTTEPLLKNPKARGHRHGNKKLTRVNQSLKPKPTIKKETSSRKQRRISSYFTRSNVNTFTNEKLTEMVLVLQKQMKQMQNLLNQKKRKAHGRQSSFHTVLSRCKKQRSSHHEDQGAPIDQVVDAMERDDHEDPQSPLISQYAAHIHRQASKNMNTTPDDIPNKTVHTTTVHASEVKFNHFWFELQPIV